MFPMPIDKAAPRWRMLYKIALPLSLVIWLLPLLAVMLTSIRSAGDLAAGNYWGWPRDFNLVENYHAVFENSPIGAYIFNSFKVTIPTVIGAVGLSCMTGLPSPSTASRAISRCSSCSSRETSCRSRY